jgi:ankyrin repeat protein
VLAWIVYAKRTLQAYELQIALGVEFGKRKLDPDSCPDVDMMVSVCAGLATIDESAGTIRLVHYTAQTFFDNETSRLFPLAETEMTKICTTYLSLKEPADSRDNGGYQSGSSSESEEDEIPIERHISYRTQRIEFFAYAAVYWGVHAREAPDAHRAVMQFLHRNDHLTRAYEAATIFHGYGYPNASLRSVNALHVTAMFGLEQATRSIFEDRFSDPNVVIRLELMGDRPLQTSEAGYYLTPLTIAAAQNHSNIVKLLLQYGAALDVMSPEERKNYRGESALSAALRKKHAVIVDILLQADDNPYAQGKMHEVNNLQVDRQNRIGTPSFCNASQSRQDEASKKPLQYTPSRIVDLPDKNGWSPLLIASRKGCDKIVNMLLHHGADVNFQCDSLTPSSGEKYILSPLYIASACRHVSIVNTLLQHGARVDTINERSLSPLAAASTQGCIEIVDVLLQYGVVIDPPIGCHYFPLYSASKNGHVEIAILLLQKGADPNLFVKGGSPPLYHAAWNGQVQLVDTLLHHGAHVNPSDDSRESPLYGACKGGHFDIARMLLERGAEIHQKNEVTHSPIHVVARKGWLRIFDLLVSHGANINQLNKLKETPLSVALHAQQEAGATPERATIIKRLKELGGKTTSEFHRDEIRELMRQRREKDAS